MSPATTEARGRQTMPREACLFAWQDATRAGRTENTFEISAYDGGIIEGHWHWDNLAFDLSGLSFASEPLPVLEAHFANARIGVTTKQQIRDAVTFEGKFLGNPRAQELRKDMLDGFPMQASLSFRPVRIEQVAKGATAQVNGRTLHGPGNIFREAQIDEVSICVFGAAPGASATAFAAGGPVIVAATFDEGSATDEELRAHFRRTPALRDEFLSEDGYLAFVRADRVRREREQDYRTRPNAFMAAVAQYQAEHKCSEGEAVQRCIELHPKLHAQLTGEIDLSPDAGDGPQDRTARLAAENRDLRDKVIAVRESDGQLRQRFAGDERLRAQFSGVDAYLAYMRIQARDARSPAFQRQLAAP